MRNGIVWIESYTKEDLVKRSRNIVLRRILTKTEKDKAEKHLHLFKKIVGYKKINKLNYKGFS